MLFAKRPFAVRETAFPFLRNRLLHPRVAALVPSRGCKGTNGLKGQQAFSPGHRPGYLGSECMRPGRAKAPMEINLADSRCCWSRHIIGGSNNNKNLSAGDCFNCDDKCACRKRAVRCASFYIYIRMHKRTCTKRGFRARASSGLKR